MVWDPLVNALGTPPDYEHRGYKFMSNGKQNTSTNLYSQYLSAGSVMLWHFLSAISNGGAAAL